MSTAGFEYGPGYVSRTTDTRITDGGRGEPYNLGVSPTGPLPRGWHRIVWTDKGDRPRYLITDDIVSAALAEVALRASTIIDEDTVRMQSWSDPENVERV